MKKAIRLSRIYKKAGSKFEIVSADGDLRILRRA